MTAYRFAATAIVLTAIAGVSLRNPTALWAGTAWTLACASLMTALVRAIVTRGDLRTRWIGFAVVAGTYFILSFNHTPLEYVEACLPTTRALDELYLAVHPEPKGATPRLVVDAWDTNAHKPGRQDGATYFNINQIHFRWAWHSLLVIPFGLIGGALAVQMASGGDPATPMRMRGRSILTLATAVLVSGIVFAAMRVPSGVTVNLTFGAFATSLAWAGLEAAASRGRRRAFWGGYLVFAWAYLLAAFGEFEVRLLIYANAPVEGYLPTSRLFGELFALLHHPPPSGMHDAWNPSYHRPGPLAPPYFHDLNRYFFVQIGHALSGIAAGIIGGLIATIPARSIPSVVVDDERT
jgi:hypothetical protein